MKNKTFVFATIIMAFIAGTIFVPAVSAQTSRVNTAPRKAPFSRGFNFNWWFELYGIEEINFGRYTEQDFANIKSLGADVIRLPAHFHRVTSGAPDYTIDPQFFRLLDRAVDMAEKYEIYIIIDFHFSEPGQSMEEIYDRMLIPVWAQVAQRYRDRSDYVVYEILNEPMGITDRRWGELQGKVIETIRKFDTKHSIIVTGADYGPIEKLSTLPRYSDTNLIYTFHFYEPFLFTHQGADYVGPGMAYVEGIPFPPDRNRMPKFLPEFKGTWVESLYNNYSREGDPSVLYRLLDRAVAFSRQRNVPIFCGEFGVIRYNAPQEDKVRWYQLVAAALDERGISRTSWDYYGYGNFGIFNVIGGDFNSDLNVEVVRALGFTPPPQTPRQAQFNTGFSFYGDFPNRMLHGVYHWGENVDLSLFDTNSAQGEFAIRWGNVPRYTAFMFAFNRNEDFTRLVSEGYSLEFKARASSAVSFDARFMNPESPSSNPWRMRYTVNLPSGGAWQTIRVPLRNMQEQGAYVEATQQFLNPRGEFSWANVIELQFVAEQQDMKGITVWIDDIKITK